MRPKGREWIRDHCDKISLHASENPSDEVFRGVRIVCRIAMTICDKLSYSIFGCVGGNRFFCANFLPFAIMKTIRITPDAIFPEEITLGAGEVLLLVVVLLVLADLVFLLVMKYKYTVGFKNRKLREFIDRLAKHEKRFRREK